MWSERILYNASNPPPGSWHGREIDYLDLSWDQCKSVLKKQTRDGEDVRVLLPPPQRLRHGDVIFEDEAKVIAIHVTPCELIAVGPAGARQLIELALELGNLHWPAQVTDQEMFFPEHETAMQALGKLGLPWRKVIRRFEPAELLASPAAAVVSPGFQVLRRAMK